MYAEAIDASRNVADITFRQLAVLNYAREELLAKQIVPASLADGIRDLKIASSAVTTQILKDKVVALLEAASATSGSATSDNPSPGAKEWGSM